MIIYINYKDHIRSSGIFINNLMTFSEKKIKYTFNKNDNFNIALICVSDSIKTDKPIIQRLDGIYLNTDVDITKLNRPIKEIFSRSIAVIYQSGISKQISDINFGIKKHNTIIHNGTVIDYDVDKTTESVMNKYYKNIYNKIIKYDHVFLAVAKWRQSKRLDSIINGFKFYKNNINKKSCLLIAGQKIKEQDGIYSIEYIHNNHIKNFHRISHCFMNLSIMDSCPNAVIEALAYGNPCVITNNQGVTEVLGNKGVVISEEPLYLKPISFNSIPQLNPEKTAIAMKECIQLKTNVIDDRFDIKHTAKQYIDFIKKYV